MRCGCGCGKITSGGEFAPGHDARHRSHLLYRWRILGAVDARDELRERNWFYHTDNRTFGVEIEFILIDGWNAEDLAGHMRGWGIDCRYTGYTHHTSAQWKIVTDSSLRADGGGYGLELVSPILKGKAGREELTRVLEALNDAPVTVNRSCGLHIHLGASNLRMKDLKTLFIFYNQHEDLIDQMLPASRRGSGNQYCRSINDIIQVIRQARTLGGIFRNYNVDRYHKLNILSYERHGTVEFRQHSGTTDPDKIIGWLDMAMAMVRISKYFEDGKVEYLTTATHAEMFDRLEIDNTTRDRWMRWIADRNPTGTHHRRVI